MYFQNITSIVKFLLVWLNNLQYVKCRKSDFVITVFILLPLKLFTLLPRVATPLAYPSPPPPTQILTFKLGSSSVCYLLKPSVTLSILDPVIFLSTLFLEHPKLVFCIMTELSFTPIQNCRQNYSFYVNLCVLTWQM